MSDLLDAAKRLLSVLEGDHSLNERHSAIDGLAVAAGVKEAAPVEEAVEPVTEETSEPDEDEATEDESDDKDEDDTVAETDESDDEGDNA